MLPSIVHSKLGIIFSGPSCTRLTTVPNTRGIKQPGRHPFLGYGLTHQMDSSKRGCQITVPSTQQVPFGSLCVTSECPTSNIVHKIPLVHEIPQMPYKSPERGSLCTSSSSVTNTRGTVKNITEDFLHPPHCHLFAKTAMGYEVRS